MAILGEGHRCQFRGMIAISWKPTETTANLQMFPAWFLGMFWTMVDSRTPAKHNCLLFLTPNQPRMASYKWTNFLRCLDLGPPAWSSLCHRTRGYHLQQDQPPGVVLMGSPIGGTGLAPSPWTAPPFAAPSPRSRRAAGALPDPQNLIDRCERCDRNEKCKNLNHPTGGFFGDHSLGSFNHIPYLSHQQEQTLQKLDFPGNEERWVCRATCGTKNA